MAVIITDPYRIFLNKCFPENRKCFLHNLSRVIFVLTQTKKKNKCIDDNYLITIYSNKNFDMIQSIATFITFWIILIDRSLVKETTNIMINLLKYRYSWKMNILYVIPQIWFRVDNHRHMSIVKQHLIRLMQMR